MSENIFGLILLEYTKEKRPRNYKLHYTVHYFTFLNRSLTVLSNGLAQWQPAPVEYHRGRY